MFKQNIDCLTDKNLNIFFSIIKCYNCNYLSIPFLFLELFLISTLKSIYMFEDLVFITHYLQQKKKSVPQTIFVVKRVFAKKKKIIFKGLYSK